MNIVFYILDANEKPLKINRYTPVCFASEIDAENYIQTHKKDILNIYGYTTLKIEKRYLIS